MLITQYNKLSSYINKLNIEIPLDHLKITRKKVVEDTGVFPRLDSISTRFINENKRGLIKCPDLGNKENFKNQILASSKK